MSRSRPRIALNMTTLNRGGVLQRAVSFVRHLEEVFAAYEWQLFASRRIEEELAQTDTTVACHQQTFDVSPARNVGARREIAAAIDGFQPDLVFTFAGPSYLKLESPELMGVADGWVTHPNRLAYQCVPGWRNRLGLAMASRYKRTWFRKGSYFSVQTATAKDGLAHRVGVPAGDIHIVPNVLATWYRNLDIPSRPIPDSGPIEMLYLSAAYSHKRHMLLPDICRELAAKDLKRCRFRITLPDTEPVWQAVRARAESLGVADMIDNIGPVPVTEGPSWYQKSHLCVVPTVLETYSATYVEAMATQTPIVTSDLDFAREACGDAALYFAPTRPAEAARCIEELISKPERLREQCQLGLAQLATTPDVPEQMNIYRQLFERLL